MFAFKNAPSVGTPLAPEFVVALPYSVEKPSLAITLLTAPPDPYLNHTFTVQA